MRGDQPAVDAGLGVLAGDVDVHHDDLVGRAERLAHRRAEDPGPRDQVRLEGHDDPAVAGQRRAAWRSPAISLGWWA